MIINSTIAMGGGRIYFVESRNRDVVEAEERRIGNKELYEEMALVALDRETGEKLWEKAKNLGEQPAVLYLSYAQEILVTQSSEPGEKAYNLATHRADDGEGIWKQSYPWRRSDHGHHLQHPVIVGEKLFAQPEYFDLRTGEKLGDTPERSKCGTMTASAKALHYRDFYDEVWDLESGKTSEFRGLRSSCWLGLISADGLLLSSESGGGCSCNFPVQLSIGYRNKADY